MTIYLTNHASVAAVQRRTASAESRACVGPGPVYSIMRHPRRHMGEEGEGRVLRLTPQSALVMPAIGAKKAYDRGDEAAAAAWRTYEEALRARWERPDWIRACAPGALRFAEEERGAFKEGECLPWDDSWWRERGPVPDGATLICACSREAAAAGRCHRVIAADVLRIAGWRVILDGREVTRG